MTTAALQHPDFDPYPIEHTLTGVFRIDGGLLIRWNDGLESRIPGLWLREFSTDNLTTHPVTREQAIALIDIPKNLTIHSATITTQGYLEVQWLPEELTSRYHPGWLRVHMPDAPQPLFHLPERVIWSTNTPVEHLWGDGQAVCEGDVAELKKWVEEIQVTGVGLLHGLPEEPGIIPKIPNLIGTTRNSNFGEVFDVTNLPNANTNANTYLTLAPHTDLATREYVPGLQFLFCIQNDATGGESVLVDGFAIAEQLKQESAEFYEILSSLAIPFGSKDRDSDYRYTAPVLEHNRCGHLSTIRYTYWLRSPMRGEFNTINTFYAALRRFQELTLVPENQMVFRLQPGELMAFDNRRMLHGRAAFEPQSGSRLFRGCYGEREELESCLRILARRGRLTKLQQIG